ncbi:MAG: PhoU domain-containing protein, partial [Candidatus Omnitrophota bacterium]
CGKLLEGEAPPDLKDNIYRIDREVNLLEKEIRKRVVTHLSVQANVDLPFSLVLMSVVKDAERIGDYAKNMYEISELLDKPIDRKSYDELFGDMDKKILREFAETRSAFINSEKATARKVLELEREIVKKCDQVVKNLAESDYPTNLAVSLVLLARYMKRVAAHLANIGSSVVLPIQDLDFFDEKLRHTKN